MPGSVPNVSRGGTQGSVPNVSRGEKKGSVPNVSLARFSRRDFLRLGAGALASAAVLGAPALLTGCGKGSGSDGPDVLEVLSSDVVTLDAFAEISDTTGYFEVKELAQYPKGTMLFASEDVTAAALCTGETASPLSTCSLVNLETGVMSPVLERAVNHDTGFSIFAVRASRELLAWVESNYLTADWMVYCASISDGKTIGQPVKLDEGNAEYDTPELAVIGTAAYWIVQPAEDGPRTSEDSLLKVAAGGSRSSTLITSHGRFNGGLSVSGNVLTAMPRAETSSGVYYELTAISAGSGATIATQVMPHSFRPSNAIYMNNAFAFTIPASYDYGGGIANVGTYYPIAGSSWLRLARQSLTPPGLCNGWLFAKSSSRTVFIDTREQQYFVVNAPDGCTDYGDYSVCVGEVARVCNYATVNRYVGTERTTSVVLRSIVPIAAGTDPVIPEPEPEPTGGGEPGESGAAGQSGEEGSGQGQ